MRSDPQSTFFIDFDVVYPGVQLDFFSLDEFARGRFAVKDV
jgi:hypothetical protein